MPRPRKGEKQSEFISRAIRAFKHEGHSQEEAEGRAYGFWQFYKNRKEKYSKPEVRKG